MYQLTLPIRIISAGTSRQRTTVASSEHGDCEADAELLDGRIAVEHEASEHEHHDQAAAVITRALVTSPETTELRLSSPAWTCSSIWLTRNTS